MVRWNRGHRSRNVEYRGRARGGRAVAGGVGGLGLVGVVIAVVVSLLGGGGGGGGFDIGIPRLDELGPAPGAGPVGAPPERNEFLEFVFDDVQATWDELFAGGGSRYEPSRLVIFDAAVETDGCGVAGSEVGPFYCPADAMVYLDQTFFDQLAGRFGAPGDFAQAYVIAHEVGHHVQNITGLSDQVRRLQSEQPDARNALSVRLELQADCLAGVWGHSAAAGGLLEPGDLEEGLDAAAAVGDDRIQSFATGRVNPESFTHGSAEQRVRWFRRGFDGGDPSACDPFSVDDP